MSIFGAMETARRALFAQQQAIAVIGQNIANANTPGYSREVAVLTALPAATAAGMEYRPALGQVGAGVEAGTPRRLRDALLDAQVRRETSAQAQWETRRDVLLLVEDIFGEPSEDGLSASLNQFWNAWQNVANAPADLAVRRGLVESAQGVATLVRRQAEQLEAVQQDAGLRLAADVGQVNQIASQIAELNRAIAVATPLGQPAHELHDQRDLLLTELSRLVRSTPRQTPDGAVSVSVGGRLLVSGGDVTGRMALTTGTDGTTSVQWQSDGAPVTLGGGTLQGWLEATQRLVPEQRAALDELAAALSTAVNAAHAAGYDLTGAAGGAFFTGADAASIAVAQELVDDPGRVAAAGTADATGDGENALQLAQLRQAKLMRAGTATVGGFFAAHVAAVGTATQQATSLAATQRDLVAHLTQRQEAVAGVSLDEEAAQLVRYQRAYEAAARLLTTLDELLERLINGTGAVGR